MVDELLGAPHIAGDAGFVEFAAVLLDGVVGEMDEFVVDVVERVVFGGETEIGLLVEPDFRRVVGLDENPLADVKLSALDYQGFLDVFLDDETEVFAEAVVADIEEVVETVYTSSS